MVITMSKETLEEKIKKMNETNLLQFVLDNPEYISDSYYSEVRKWIEARLLILTT